ncbi:hypothetical protein GCM10008015_11210 [Flavobacterium palustre]|uniref:Uncharacterized protein n=1 Tax=Flavobacterium palustre TaxID=1476463 RepID=A0ABQ1HDH6_9FLAO|nr:hypothetical protein GCM10008015_11210 [Flavobacterium palustre]
MDIWNTEKIPNPKIPNENNSTMSLFCIEKRMILLSILVKINKLLVRIIRKGITQKPLIIKKQLVKKYLFILV